MGRRHKKSGRSEKGMERAKLTQYDLEHMDTAVESRNPAHQANSLVNSESAETEAAAQPDAEDTGAVEISTPPSLCSKYQFIRELGHGGQAKVYLANRLKDNKLVTVKQLNIDSVKAWKEYELFNREAEVLSKLNVNGVARFYDAIECLEDRPACSYIIQEFIEGASLAKMLKDGHRFKTDEVYDILLQMLNILKQLQSMDPPVIHRDIKPSNIMISPNKDGSYKVTLIDFGAVANPQVQSGGSTVAGTYGYMPPEQLMGRPLPASDIYSLGAVAVELFSGVSPAQIQVKDFRLIFEPYVEQLPVVVVNTLRSMLEPKAEDRLQNIDELIKAFTDYKNENYESGNSLPVKADKNKQLNKKLVEVESIGNPGNMEVWQGLPDNTPRAVPEVLVEYLEKTQITRRDGSDRPGWISRHPCMTAYLLIVFGVVLEMFFTMGMTALTIVPVLLVVFMFFGMIGYDNSADDYHSIREKSENGMSVNRGELSELIAKGRKTVATIVDVEYLPVPHNGVSHQHDLVVSQHSPSFRVKYKFNPPDDAREEDLVHEYIAHTSPETFYKKGDPLPILYNIEKKYFGDTVISMPYPFPLTDESINDLVYKSDSPHSEFEYAPYHVSEDMTHTYEYDNNVRPVLDAKNRQALLNAIDSKMWLLDRDESLSILLDYARNRILNTDDVELRKALIDALDKIYHYATVSKTRKHVIQFLTAYFNGDLEGLLPCVEEIRVVRHARYLPERILNKDNNDAFLVHSLDDLASKTHVKREKLVKMLFNDPDMNDSVFDDYMFASPAEKTKVLEEVKSIMINQFCDSLNPFADECAQVFEQTAVLNKSSYDYQSHFEQMASQRSRKALLEKIANDLWLIDDLDVAMEVIKYGKLHVWNSDDYGLRKTFMEALLKIYHYANKPATKLYVIQYVVCFISNRVSGLSPCLSEISALRNYSRDDLPRQLVNALKVFSN